MPQESYERILCTLNEVKWLYKCFSVLTLRECVVFEPIRLLTRPGYRKLRIRSVYDGSLARQGSGGDGC